MKRIYDVEQRIYIKGQTKDFVPTSIWRHLRAFDDDEVMNYERRYGYQSFQELWELVDSGVVLNAEIAQGLFSRKIRFKSGIHYYTVTERHFKEVTIWWHCKECTTTSLKTLYEEMPAHEFIGYLQENNINLSIDK